MSKCKRTLAFFVIYLCSAQLAFGSICYKINLTSNRSPAAYGHDIEIAPLLKKIEEFRVEIKGKELESDCDNDATDALETAVVEADQVQDIDPNLITFDTNTEAAFKKYFKDLEKNSCGSFHYSFDPETPAEEMQECQPKRINGLIDEIVTKAMEEDKKDEDDQDPPVTFKVMDPKVRELHKKGEFYMQEVRKYLEDDDFNEEERKKLLVQFLYNVALPMRDLIVMKRSYMPAEYDGAHYYNSLLPQIPTRLFPKEDLDSRDLITLGPNPSEEPFYIEMIDKKWGRTELKYNETQVLSRDILTLIKAPIGRNYIRALKWMTLHMMLSQVYIYDSMGGKRKEQEIEIPKSCQNHFNGDLPESFKFKFDEGLGVNYMDNILGAHGLTISQDNQYMEYYMNNVNRDPTKNGYSGLMPFENYKNAQLGLKNNSGISAPAIDDISHFDTVMSLRIPEASNVFHGEKKVGSLGSRVTKKFTYHGSELFEKIVSQPNEMKLYEVKASEERKVMIDPRRQNLSTYLVELLQRKSALHYEEIISDSLVNSLKNKRIKIDLPALFGSVVWRTWGLKSLRIAIAKNIDNKENGFKSVVSSFCSKINSSRFCVKNDTKKTMQKLSDYLGLFTENGEFTPTRRIKEERLESFYPALSKLWNYFRDQSESLEEARPLELEFLKDQMKAQNPWARVRFSYLVAMDELSNVKEGHDPSYRYNGGYYQNYTPRTNSSCFSGHIETRISKLNTAASKLGIDQPLYPSHATKLLEEDEKEYIWNDIIESTDEGNSRLFTVVASDGKEYYKHLEDISYQTILTKASVEKLKNKMPVRLSGEDQDLINQVLDSPMAKYGDFFFELYKLRGDVEKQTAYFERFSKENGVDNDFMAKLSFLSIDNDLKRPFFHALIRKAADTRKMKIMENLNSFCELEPHDHESFKTLFYATSKSQNKLNQMAGLPGVPENILDKMNSMSPDEWKDLKLGLGAGLLGVGAILIGSACTGLTGGLCAPLGIIMIGAGLKAMDMQVELIGREFNRKSDADRYEKKIKIMEGLGYANKGSAGEVSRGWFWAAFEVISIIPLIGVVSRAATVGTKLAVVSGKHLLRSSGKVAFKQSAKRVLAEADVKLARYVLEFDSLATDFGLNAAARSGGKPAAEAAAELTARLSKAGVPKKEIAKTMSKYEKLMFNFSKGKISSQSLVKGISHIMAPFKKALSGTSNTLRREFGRISVKESKNVIDKQTAKVVSSYFGHNPKALHNVFKSFTGKRLDKAIKAYDKVKDVTWFVGKFPVLPNNPTILNRAAHAMKGLGYVGKGLARTPYKIWTAIRKMRVEFLAKNATKMRALEADLKLLAKNGGDLEQFIMRNMDDLTDVLMKVPMRKRELPYLILWQGAPHIQKVGRVPLLHFMADGMILRKFFAARGRLVYESLKAEARSAIGLSTFVSADTTMGAFRSFQESIANAATEMTEVEGKKLITKYKKLETEISEALLESYTTRGGDGVFKFKDGQKVYEMNVETFKKLIFNPQSPADNALGHAIWESMSTEDLFKMQGLNDVAHRVVQELADYKSVDEFQRFLNALKIVIIKRDPGVVEFM
ncbi:MAG: hypothetical protein HN576_06435 [Bacteriovoracaceae bacterium]|nr:hypothetical protein [Bacteriovoracaceae bacterium]